MVSILDNFLENLKILCIEILCDIFSEMSNSSNSCVAPIWSADKTTEYLYFSKSSATIIFLSEHYNTRFRSWKQCEKMCPKNCSVKNSAQKIEV